MAEYKRSNFYSWEQRWTPKTITELRDFIYLTMLGVYENVATISL